MIKYLNNLKYQLNHHPIVSSLHCSVSRVLRNLPIAADFLAEPSIAKASRVPQTSSSFGSRGSEIGNFVRKPTQHIFAFQFE